MTVAAWQPVFPIPHDAGTPDLETILGAAVLDSHQIFDVQARLLGYVAVTNEDVVPVQYGRNGTGTLWERRQWDEGGTFINMAAAFLKRQGHAIGADEEIAKWDGETADKLAAMDLPPIKWAIPELFPCGLILLAGRAKGGKTTLTRNWGLAISGAFPAMGNIEVETGQVLYLSLEEGRDIFRPKMLHMLQGAAAPKNLEIFYEWPRIDDGGLERLGTWAAARTKRRAIFIDLWTRFSPASMSQADGRNAYEREYAAMMPLKQFAHAQNLAVFLLHHENKLGQISGTMAMSGAPDTLAMWKRGKGEIRGTLSLEGRQIEAHDLTIEYDKGTSAIINLGEAAAIRTSDERISLLAEMRTLDTPATPNQLATALGKSGNAIRMLLWKLKKTGAVREVSGGKYVLADAGPQTRAYKDD